MKGPEIDDLKHFGKMPDEQIDLMQAALLLAAAQHEGLSTFKYYTHIDEIRDAVKKAHSDALSEGQPDIVETRLRALRTVIVDQMGYKGDTKTYDDLQNADMIRVIERRKGLPISLSIIYIQVARALNWEAYGLNIPGHFVVRMDMAASRIIFDPFNDAEELQAPELRRLVKQTLGEDAELSADYYEPASNRAILIRLQNNIKIRQIENEDYEGALDTVEAMRSIDPNEYRLLLDAGVLNLKLERLQQAGESLERYIGMAPDNYDRHDASQLLQQIKKSLQ